MIARTWSTAHDRDPHRYLIAEIGEDPIGRMKKRKNAQSLEKTGSAQ